MTLKLRVLTLSVALTAGLLAGASPCAATQYTGTKITQIFTSKADVFFVYVTGGTKTGTTPACATATTTFKRFSIKPSSLTGRTLISSVLLAFAEGKTVTIVGQNETPTDPQCSDWGDTESIRDLSI